MPTRMMFRLPGEMTHGSTPTEALRSDRQPALKHVNNSHRSASLPSNAVFWNAGASIIRVKSGHCDTSTQTCPNPPFTQSLLHKLAVISARYYCNRTQNSQRFSTYVHRFHSKFIITLICIISIKKNSSLICRSFTLLFMNCATFRSIEIEIMYLACRRWRSEGLRLDRG